MYQFDIYRGAREEMFAKSPPDFYYGQCGDGGALSDSAILTRELKDYVRLTTTKYPTCVFVLRSKFPEISDEQWTEAGEVFGIQRP